MLRTYVKNMIESDKDLNSNTRGLIDAYRNQEDAVFYKKAYQIALIAEKIFWESCELLNNDLSLEEYINDIQIIPKAWCQNIPKENLKKIHFKTEYKNGILHLILNQRLPSLRVHKEFLRKYANQIEIAFRKETIDIDTPRRKQVLVYIHHYCEGYRRDNDNYYTKEISDLISKKYMFGSDNPSDLSVVTVSKKDTKNYTEMYLVPKEIFIGFAADMCLFLE